MSDAIRIDQLQKTIRVGFWGKPKRLLEDVTFSVGVGHTVGFIGGNGAGKSTTIKHIIGLARPTSGSVVVLGGDPWQTSIRRRLGYMPELPTLAPTLTARELITLHAGLCAGGDIRRRADTWLARVDLAAHADARVGGFSKGMQTRLSLALALVHDPELLVLDEPMSGLDPVGRQMVRQILHEQGAAGRTVFFSSHVLADVEALCDSVAVIRAGKLVYFGATSDAVGTQPTRWRLRVTTPGGAPPTLPGEASEAGARLSEVKKEGDTFLVVVDAPDGVAAAVALRDAGARVLSMDALRPTLEERTANLIGSAS